MDWRKVLEQIDAQTARAFVVAARRVIDAMLVEGRRVEQARGPAAHDYASAGLSRAAPAGGWLSDAELDAAVQRMGEAIAAEKWVDGALFAIRVLSAIAAP